MKWFLQRVLAALATLLVVVVGAGVVLRLQYTGDIAPWAVSNGGNALWMGHAWVDGRNGAEELAELAPRIVEGEIRDVYVHVGPVEFDGTLERERYAAAEEFLDSFRAELPDVRVSAWVGQRVEPGHLDLTDEESRGRVVEGAGDLVATGFDGVHYNFEPIGNNDPGFLDLLDETREALPEDTLLSSAVPQIEPLAGLGFPVRLLSGKSKYWSTTYLGQVAERLDQVAVMSYDTAMPTRSLYGGFVARQTRLALGAVPEDVHLLMGFPAYPDDHATRDPDAETPEPATRGVRLGLSSLEERRENFGLAVYVDFAATPEQWEGYQRGWVAPEESG